MTTHRVIDDLPRTCERKPYLFFFFLFIPSPVSNPTIRIPAGGKRKKNGM